MKQHQQNLLALYETALAAVHGTTVIEHYLPTLQTQLTKPLKTTLKTPRQQDSSSIATLHAIAIGKAAEAMLQGLLNNPELALKLTLKDALLISKHGHISAKMKASQQPIIHCIESDHPVPSDASLYAGQALLHYIEKLPANSLCIVLLSGGTSSLVEVLNEQWTLAELQTLTQWMLDHAWSIDAINAVRSRISCIKGGGLWHYLLASQATQWHCLLISDVPSDDERVIGSGLLFPSTKTTIPQSLPTQWRNKLAKPPLITVPKDFSSAIIATNRHAQQAAVTMAQQLGYRVKCDYRILQGDAVTIAQQCVQALRDNRGIVMIWGAETTVTLPAVAGKGGRNQHVALAAAIDMAQHADQHMLLLSAATDGTDGVTDDAGGMVNQHTVAHAKKQGIDAQQALTTANANLFLRASQALITTGVTGTNVMDLIIGYARALDK